MGSVFAPDETAPLVLGSVFSDFPGLTLGVAEKVDMGCFQSLKLKYKQLRKISHSTRDTETPAGRDKLAARIARENKEELRQKVAQHPHSHYSNGPRR